MGTTSASGTTAGQQALLDMNARIVKFEKIEPLLLGCAVEPSSKIHYITLCTVNQGVPSITQASCATTPSSTTTRSQVDWMRAHFDHDRVAMDLSSFPLK